MIVILSTLSLIVILTTNERKNPYDVRSSAL